MKTIGLEIGNWIYDKDGRKVIVWGIDPSHDHIWVNHTGGSAVYKVKTKHINPIPLIKQWLRDFEFEKSKQPNGTVFWGRRSDPFRIFESFDNNYKLFGYEYTVIFRYVHQLQNLYLPLTGKELIKT